jgi:hypothetical protein
MPKRKKAQKSNPDSPLDQYDSVTLMAALNSFERSLGWDVFKSFLYYQAAAHGTMSNVLVQQSGKQAEACAAGAKAEVLREVMDVFMEQLKQKIKGTEGVVESPRPDDEVVN